MAQSKSTELLDAKFDLPDSLTVRQQLAIAHKIASTARDSLILAWWEITKTHMTNWQSAAIPDPAVIDLDTDTRREVAEIIFWCANATAGWYTELGELEKNS